MPQGGREDLNMEDSGYATYQDPRLMPLDEPDDDDDFSGLFTQMLLERGWLKRPRVKIQLSHGGIMPVRAHSTDAGADIFTPEGFRLAPHSSEIICTGVHVELPPFTVGMLKSKSGLNVKHDIIGEGVIDEGFSNEIRVKLYNMGDKPRIFRRGDKIIQLVIMPVLYPAFLEVDEITGGERGLAGIGSTGR